jgi:hypothetical protein
MPSPDELIRLWLAGGVANALTSALLQPIDIAKTRMQTAPPPALSLCGTLRVMRTEGGGVLRGLFLPGLGASVAREMLSSGIRAGFYTPTRDAYARVLGGDAGPGGGAASGVAPKIAAAMTTGVIGSLIANPVDVIKVRLFCEPGRYPRGLLRALAELHATEGVAGMYRGLAPSTLRAAAVAAGLLGTYDVVKTALRGVIAAGAADRAVAGARSASLHETAGAPPLAAAGEQEGALLHVSASLITGVVAAFISAPVDMLKARAMAGAGAPLTIAAALRQLRAEGGGFPLTLFRGVAPAYMRIGPHALIAIPLFEQLRLLLGLDAV